MSLRDAGHDLGHHAISKHGEKSVAEHGLCFGSILVLLALAAFALQWLIETLA
jgi:hypothetical protein